MLLSLALSDPAMRPAIVYCGTRRDVEDVTERLRSEGLLAVGYHAGMPADERASAQHRFMDGDAEIVVATNAFGMGVDKADVRAVVHWAIPKSVEAYYQEVGRGGRDGKPARAILLASRADLGRLINFIKRDAVEPDDVLAYVRRLEAPAAASGRDRRASRRSRPGLPRGRRARWTVRARARAGAGGCRSRLLRRRRPRGRVDLPGGARPRLARLPRGRVVQLGLGRVPAPQPARPLRRQPARRAVGPVLRRVRSRHDRPARPRVADPARGPSGRRAPDAPPRRSGRRRAARAPARVAHPRLQRQARATPSLTTARSNRSPSLRPSSLTELARIKGVGPAFVERHGEDVLSLVAAA